MAVLQQRSGSASSPVFLLRTENTRIGRKSDCEIFLDSDDISRYHARVFRDGNRYLVEDTQSRNGTQVNGQTIAGPVVLEEGDEITLSSLHFTFLNDDLLFEDSSHYRHDLSAMVFSEDSGSDVCGDDPIWVSSGEHLPAEVFGLHGLDARTVVSRCSVGTGVNGWPTLKQPEHKLSQAFHVLHRLRGSATQAEVLSSVVGALFEVFNQAEQVAIVLRCGESNGFVIAAAKCRRGRGKVKVFVPLIFSAMESTESILYAGREHPQADTKSPLNKLIVRYLLASPLIDKEGSVCGAIQIESGQSGGFEPSHTEFLANLSHVISCRLDDTTVADLVFRRRSAEATEQLRRQLVPVNLPQVQGFAARHLLMTIPSSAADLVDCVRLSNGNLGCFILDVPGRGSAAVNAMATIGQVVTRAMMSSDSPAAILRIVEEEMKDRGLQIPLVTSLCVAILDPEQSSVTMSVAGHCPVYYFGQKEVTSLATEALAGPPLGAINEDYSDLKVLLADEDVLLLCSDGISRIPSAEGTLVSQNGVCQLLQEADSMNRNGLEGRVQRGIEQLLGTSMQQDDIVLLAIHKTNSSVEVNTYRPGETQVPR